MHKASRRQASSLPVVERVRVALREKVVPEGAPPATQKALERQVSIAVKVKDNAALLEAYYELAAFWEEKGDAAAVQKYLELCVELIEKLRGAKSELTLEDVMPLARVLEHQGKVTLVRSLFHQLVTEIASKNNYNMAAYMVLYEKLLDATLRSGNLAAAMQEQQTLQRLRESNLPATMQWYHPPQGEMRVVTHIEHMRTSVELGRFCLAREEWEAARTELQKVADWREEIRQLGKDWRRSDAPLAARARSLEIVADAVFGLGQAYAGMGRSQTAERRMLEGVGHWEELVALEDACGVRSTCAHTEADSAHVRQLVEAHLALAAFLTAGSRFVESVKHLSAAIAAMERLPLRAGSPAYIRTLRARAQASLDCNDIGGAFRDYDECARLTATLHGEDSAAVALCRADQARFLSYMSTPSPQDCAAALDLAAGALAALERRHPPPPPPAADPPVFALPLRVYGSLLARLGRLDEAVGVLRRYRAVTAAAPKCERRPADRIAALESLAEACTNRRAVAAAAAAAGPAAARGRHPPPGPDAADPGAGGGLSEGELAREAHSALREAVVLAVEEENAGRKDLPRLARLRAALGAVARRQAVPLEARYAHSRLRRCDNRLCGRPESRPDLYHRSLGARGALCFCSDECVAAYRGWAAGNPWLAPESTAAAGTLSEALVLRVLQALPERPHWFRVACTCARLWRLVSAHRTALRLPAAARAPRLGEAGLARLLGRSAALRHVDMGTCTAVTDGVLRQLGASCPRLLSLSLRGCASVTDAGVAAVAAGCRALERLDLSHCPLLSDDALAAAVARLAGLRFLSLAHCPLISELGLAAVAAACPRLGYVDLSHCPRVTDGAVRALLRGCAGVYYLNLRGLCGLTTAELRRVERRVARVEGLPWREVVASDLSEPLRVEA